MEPPPFVVAVIVVAPGEVDTRETATPGGERAVVEVGVDKDPRLGRGRSDQHEDEREKNDEANQGAGHGAKGE